jgi:hypothetical protein
MEQTHTVQAPVGDEPLSAGPMSPAVFALFLDDAVEALETTIPRARLSHVIVRALGLLKSHGHRSSKP